ncbi:hypothetical protein G7054_g10818 [Neopestalotiopsis clavispora]|nr:hypothetical protein G7054_g10818 [Neopestalotiopsis clavispora]
MAARPSSAGQAKTTNLPLVTVDASAVGFSKIMNVLKDKVPTEPKGGSAKGYSIRSMTSWEGVQEVMDRAAAEHASKSGAKGKARAVANFIGNKADPAKRLTAVIPDSGYTKPIVGTLNFLLDAFQKAGRVRTDVKDGIEKLKDHFDLVQAYLELYATNSKVAEAALELYVTILIAIEEVIDYYTGHIAIKGLKTLWEGDKYQEKMLTCLKTVGDVGQKLILQADTAQKQNIQIGEDCNDYGRRDQREAHKNTGFSSLEARLDNQKDMMILEARAFMNNFVPLLEQYSRKLDIIEINDKERHRVYIAENMMLREQLKRATTPEIWYSEPTTTCNSLLEFLNSSDIDEIDIAYITKTQLSHGTPGRIRIDHIMKSEEFVHWITEPMSKELLIHGNSATTPISPLSVFCTLLIQNLRQVPNFVCVSFFCACHLHEPQGGPSMLIKSLMAQLLQQRAHFDVRFITFEMAELMENGNIGTYCSVFGQLVQQMARDETMFCIIDGANFYERDEEICHEFGEVLCFLLDLTKSQTKFKILLTSPSITTEIRKAIHNEDYLSLPEQGRNTESFSPLRFERQLNESMQLLDD